MYSSVLPCDGEQHEKETAGRVAFRSEERKETAKSLDGRTRGGKNDINEGIKQKASFSASATTTTPHRLSFREKSEEMRGGGGVYTDKGKPKKEREKNKEGEGGVFLTG